MSDIARNVFGLPNTRAQALASLGNTPKTLFIRQTKNDEEERIIGNRTRPFAYIFRASEQEKNLIDKALSTSGLIMTEFVIRAITNKPIIVIDHAGEMLAEVYKLSRFGRNAADILNSLEMIQDYGR